MGAAVLLLPVKNKCKTVKQRSDKATSPNQGEPSPEADEDRPVRRRRGAGDAHLWAGVLCAWGQVPSFPWTYEKIL